MLSIGMFTNCQTCLSLWREYAAARKRHIPLREEFKAAVSERDNDRTLRVVPGLEAALRRRTEIRRAIRVHEAEHASVADEPVRSESAKAAG